jgi:hypothetical protein
VSQLVDIEMTTQAVADHLGWSRMTAWRRMSRVMREHPGVVRKSARGLVGRARELATHIPELRGPTPVDTELSAIRSRVTDLEQQLTAETSARLEFQRTTAAWFARHVSPKQSQTIPYVTAGANLSVSIQP